MKRLVLAGLAILVIAGCRPMVTIPAGLRPRMTPAEVEQLALEQIHSMEQMAGVVLRPARVLRITANAGGVAAPGFDGVTWLVDAEGTFATNRGPVAGAVPPAPTGHFEISDADGTIVGFGFP
jgi:hypothetical protein